MLPAEASSHAVLALVQAGQAVVERVQRYKALRIFSAQDEHSTTAVSDVPQATVGPFLLAIAQCMPHRASTAR